MGFNSDPASSKSTTRNTNNTQNAGFSEISGTASSLMLTLGDKVKNPTINVLDQGAIQGAFGFAGEFANQALHQLELQGTQSASSIKDAIGAVLEAGRGDAENVTLSVVKWGAVAAIAYFVARAFKG